MIKNFLKRLAFLNLILWGKKTLNYHRLSRTNLEDAPEHRGKKPPRQ